MFSCNLPPHHSRRKFHIGRVHVCLAVICHHFILGEESTFSAKKSTCVFSCNLPPHHSRRKIPPRSVVRIRDSITPVFFRSDAPSTDPLRCIVRKVRATPRLGRLSVWSASVSMHARATRIASWPLFGLCYFAVCPPIPRADSEEPSVLLFPVRTVKTDPWASLTVNTDRWTTVTVNIGHRITLTLNIDPWTTLTGNTDP